jgi:Family of unknown function (DUF5687)
MHRTRHIPTYSLLIRNQWKTVWRGLRAQQGWLMWVVLAVMGVYSAFTLLTLGLYFDRFTGQVFPTDDPIHIVNRYLLAAFISLFFMRFLFQKTPGMRIVPYLHLPLSRTRLVLFFQASSLLSVHNVYPMLFFVPFWIRFVLPVHDPGGQIFWLGSVIVILAGSHFANLLLRSILKQRSVIFYLLMILFIAVTVIDETAGLGMFQSVSMYLFDRILSGDILPFVLLSSVAAAIAIMSTAALLRSLRRTEESRSSIAPHRTRIVPARYGTTGQLVYLEWLLMWRNRRPRHFLLVSLLFSTMYLFLLLVSGTFQSNVAGVVIGLFASGGFALNYGQLMFSWDSTHYDLLLTRNVTFRQIVKAKLIILQASCVVMFAISLPLILWLRPDLMPIHITLLIYNAGITSVLVMELASRNRNAVDIGRSGGFFNYEGFSARHWLWSIPTALPPMLLMAAFSDHPALGLTALASIGFISLLSTDLWTRYFSRGLRSRKYRMSAGFRVYAR